MIKHCELEFGSWTYDGLKMDVHFYEQNENIDLSNYVPSNEWNVIASPARKNIKYYKCCIEPYPHLTFQLVLQRVVKSLFCFLCVNLSKFKTF